MVNGCLASIDLTFCSRGADADHRDGATEVPLVHEEDAGEELHHIQLLKLHFRSFIGPEMPFATSFQGEIPFDPSNFGAPKGF